jgi:hypothetical protein
MDDTGRGRLSAPNVVGCRNVWCPQIVADPRGLDTPARPLPGPPDSAPLDYNLVRGVAGRIIALTVVAVFLAWQLS